MQACDRCHRRKSRCDKQRPECSDCKKASVPCAYTDRSREYGRERLEAIEQRLRQADAKNKALSSELVQLRASQRLSESAAPISRDRLSVNASETPDHNGCSGGDDGRNTSNIPALPASDLINEVSFLASNAAGDRHFLGSTSGVLFADLVRASVNVAESQSKSRYSSGRAADRGIFEIPAAYKGKDASHVLLPEDLTRKLVQSYLAHDHIAYPFLLPSYLFSIIDLIYSDASYYDDNAYEAFVFDMVLAIANANVYKYDWQMLPSAESHHSRAMTRIGEVFQVGGLKSLQAILLLCQYRTGSSIQDTSASMWHLVGIAVRIAYELGLHHESAYSIKNGDSDTSSSFREQEIRRRCFWSVLAMDRVVSFTLGRPLAINTDDINIELPSTELDYVVNSGLSDRDQSFNRTAVFVHIVRYRLLCGKIMRSLHGLKKPQHNERDIYLLRDSLASQLDDWFRDTSTLELLDAGSNSPLPHHRSSFRSREWYEIIYNNAILMLFRPSPMLSDISKEPTTLQKIFSSSKQAILGYASLHRSRKINYSWITLHSVFMAGLAYIYAVSCHFRERRRQSPAGAMLATNPTAIEIVNDTRACSNVLVAVSERWNALRHCHEVFDRLSDAVLEDAIKLHTGVARSAAPVHSVPTPQSNTALESGSGSYVDSQHPHSKNTGPPSNSDGTAWYDPAARLIDQGQGLYTQTSPLAVDNEFRNCFGDLQHLYHQQYNGDPVMQLSQDWLGYLDGFDNFLPMGEQAGFASEH
ncbi:hypothetical protein V500_08949 [Pseudogymnoascus sp. VKM F-4518 (FW-2643)]|nr:hypothetical protein V500_08949 [Pseudogymnoascus sp. VKM F-4518 (FW-2643)]